MIRDNVRERDQALGSGPTWHQGQLMKKGEARMIIIIIVCITIIYIYICIYREREMLCYICMYIYIYIYIYVICYYIMIASNAIIISTCRGGPEARLRGQRLPAVQRAGHLF